MHRRQLDFLSIRLREDGEPERVGQTSPADVAIPRETEELLECFPGAQGGAKPDDRPQLILAVVPETVDSLLVRRRLRPLQPARAASPHGCVCFRRRSRIASPGEDGRARMAPLRPMTLVTVASATDSAALGQVRSR